MENRRLGASGLKISEIAFGNWLTHGAQVDDEVAKACISAAMDAGITAFDTADVYAATRAEEVLGRALHGVRRESIQMFSKVYFPTGHGPNDSGLSRKHIFESAHASLRRLRTDYLDLYQAHRYDHETQLAETLRAFDDLIRQGKVLYVGVSEWRADEIAAGPADCRRPGSGSDRIQPTDVQHAVEGNRVRGDTDVREQRDRPNRVVAHRAGGAFR
jgi:aryl-alcohol dehydrogenase-like predicted oxidoreductase